MIFPTRKKMSKGKSVKAVAQFGCSQDTAGKIVMQQASNVQFTKGIGYAGSFVRKEEGVLQYLCAVNGDQVVLRSGGLNMGLRTFPQLANCSSVAWTFDANNNTLLVSGNNATYRIFSGNIFKICDTEFDSIAVCQGRVFALKGKRIYLSSATETTFEDDLWIDLPTACVAIVNNGELYAVGNDVYKLQIDGEESNIKISKICSNVGNVQGKTVCAYGNKIMFVANGSVVALQHGAIKVVTQIEATAICATMHNGLYYVCAQIDGQTFVTSVDTHTGKVISLHHVSAKNIYSNGNNLWVSDGSSGFELSGTTQDCHWISKSINFDNQATVKHLHRLMIHTATDVDVHINSDAKRIYHIKGKDVLQSLLVVGHGKDITLELHSNVGMSVKELGLVARASEVCL